MISVRIVILTVVISSLVIAIYPRKVVSGIRKNTSRTNCTCGWVNRNSQRILGGKQTKINEYPMMAALIYRHLIILGIIEKDNVYYCGATVITHRHLITTAHCLHDPDGKLLNSNEMGVILGAHDLTKLNYSDSNIMRTPEKLILHSRYKWKAIYDLGIIIMPHIEFKKIIGPACLPTSRFNVTSRKLKVIGWGFTSSIGQTSEVLRHTDVTGILHEDCDRYWGRDVKRPFEHQDPYQVCTFQPNTSQCVGDSGGPILWRDPLTNRYSLVATPSYGAPECHTLPSVASDISYFLPWIQQTISETYPEEKTCSRV